MALHFEDGDLTKIGIAGRVEALEEALEVFGEFDGKNGVRLATEDLTEGDGGEADGGVFGLFVGIVSGSAPFDPILGTDQIDGFVGGDGHQEWPKVVAVEELGETALTEAEAEAIEGGEGDVFLVGG